MSDISINIASRMPEKKMDLQEHTVMANAIRALAMDAVEKAQSGHPGMPMGMADIATVLFSRYLKFNPDDPSWPDRDRFMLSNGHGCMLLYALNYLTGYKGMTLDQIKNFRQLGSHTAGHPEYDLALGIETTTGPLGQGLGNAVGMALAERLLNAQFGDDLVNHFTYVFAGDGCLSEGISQEVISLAGHLKLSKLIVFFDDNAVTIDGPTSLSISDDHCKRFEASGWHTQRIDGHDPQAIAQAIENAQNSNRPSMIACKTTIGYGAPTKAGKAIAHGAPLGAGEIAAARVKLDWPYPAFEIPEDILNQWRQVGYRCTDQYTAWKQRFEDSSHRLEFQRRIDGQLPEGWTKTIKALTDKWTQEPQSKATRQLSQSVLDELAKAIPELIGGSADLTGSNNTKAEGMEAVTADHYQGRYIYYGVREHGMASIMNGMALHRGVIPYGGTFLTFTDYCRPAIRLAALMKQRVIYVMTHDSIGLGEDGPTHQPIEHLASLRAMPNLQVFRPADAVEVAECWQVALESHVPSIIALTRQKVKHVRIQRSDKNLCQFGAYVLIEPEQPRQLTLLATGSEVGLAVDVCEALGKNNIYAAVVSMPCLEKFEQQGDAYRQSVLGPDNHMRVSIEAAGTFGWERYVGPNGLMIGMTSFGASAPVEDLFEHFGFTVEAIVGKIKERV